MRASARGLLIPALILSMSGAVYAQGGGAGGGEGAEGHWVATGPDKGEPAWERPTQVVPLARRQACRVRAQWATPPVRRRSRCRRKGEWMRLPPAAE
jgi:hypothetical protein